MISASPCHPLREDVSWNMIKNKISVCYPVILFVRMWVEISNGNMFQKVRTVILFVRMWVEIQSITLGAPYVIVILFVRMWVEMMCTGIQSIESQQSSSSWGCELKCICKDWGKVKKDVILFVRMWVEMLTTIRLSDLWSSSSSWGCELKFI